MVTESKPMTVSTHEDVAALLARLMAAAASSPRTRPPREIGAPPKGGAHQALRAWEQGAPYVIPQPVLFEDVGTR